MPEKKVDDRDPGKVALEKAKDAGGNTLWLM
jgi:hypothetical protein